jgi:hypothetical protein
MHLVRKSIGTHGSRRKEKSGPDLKMRQPKNVFENLGCCFAATFNLSPAIFAKIGQNSLSNKKLGLAAAALCAWEESAVPVAQEGQKRGLFNKGCVWFPWTGAGWMCPTPKKTLPILVFSPLPVKSCAKSATFQRVAG